MNRWITLCLAVAAMAAVSCAQAGTLHVSNPNVLWRLVHKGCAPAARQHHYPPRPCAEVSAPPGHFQRGYAVLKDIRGRYQYLVLPLARITGIESPTLLQADAPNYFADAWAARLYVAAALHRFVPRDDLSLAVNSEFGRTQNQLHIHVDCIRPGVQRILHRLRAHITHRWQLLPHRLLGHRYLARWVGGRSLAIDPFRALAQALPKDARMGWYGLAVVGAVSAAGRPGFILLATRANMATANRGSTEELQDRACAVVKHRRQ